MLDSGKTRVFGAVVLALLVGVAIGNGFRTQEALDGSAKWWEAQVNSHAHDQSRKDWTACDRILNQ